MNKEAATLATLLPPAHVLLKLKAADKSQLIVALAAAAAASASCPAEALATALRNREALGSTGVGRGIAVPHARLPALDPPGAGLLCFFARLDRPVEYEAIDGKKVDLVFLLLGPTREANAHLATLAAVSRRLRDAAVADAVRHATSAEAIVALLVEK